MFGIFALHQSKKISFSPSENPFVRAEPDIIKGPDFYEILVEVKGISGSL